MFHTLTVQRDIYLINSIHFSKQMRCVIHFTPLTPFVAILQSNPCHQEKCLMRTLNCKVLQLTAMRRSDERREDTIDILHFEWANKTITKDGVTENNYSNRLMKT